MRCPRCQSHDLYAIDAYQGIVKSLGCLTCGHVWEAPVDHSVEHFVPGDYRKAVDIEGEL